DGDPLNADFRARFSITSFSAVRLIAEGLHGHLFFLDKPGMTSDDLVLGDLTARQLASRLRSLYLVNRVEHTVLLEERVRMARDLHDGAFHSLTGMAFAVERLLRTPELDPKQTRNSLRQIVVGLQDAQRTLRLLIEDLRAADRDVSDLSLDTEIEQVATRIERQWNVKVALTVIDVAGIPARQWADVCLIVQEALTN